MSDEPAVQPFDIRDELSRGVTVLEASAGTGKTFTIASLAARCVADGIPLNQLLLVSFTLAATGELRDRVQERLVEAHRALAEGVADDEPDELLWLLVNGSAEEVERRRQRLVRAVADFDAATIATTHGFCQEVLGSLGVGGDVDREHRFVDDPRALVDEVVSDLYARGFVEREALFGPREASEIVSFAIRNPTAAIAPAGMAASVARARVQLVTRAREVFEERKRRAAVLTFDDLLTRLEAALSGDGGDAIVERLRQRYRVVLIDEFQDTDPTQWRIVKRAFAHPDGTLVLIGDPKQAVYAFRGADVYAYLDAAHEAAQRTLSENWRSGAGLVSAYDALFAGARLGHDEIVCRPVQAASEDRTARLVDAPVSTPLRIRVLRRDLPSVERTPAAGMAKGPSAEKHVLRDLAAEVIALLGSPARIEGRREPGAPGGEAISPSDVAVLVRSKRQVEQVEQALREVGVPTVVKATGSVFATTAAHDWLRLLEALEQPAAGRRARALALTPFLDWSAEQLVSATDAEWEALHVRLARWAQLLRSGGVATLTQAVIVEERLPARLLAREDGGRELTDLRHIAELLHAAAVEGRDGIVALAAWLRRRIDAAAQDSETGERARRLESDAPAVKVLTIHASKGLEFPVVLCPFLWKSRLDRDLPRDPVTFHDPEHENERTIDVSLDGGAYARHRARAREEERGEELRLAYVALTRARCQAIVWWIGAWVERDSPFGRLVFSRRADGSVPPYGDRTPEDDEALERLHGLAERAPGCIAVETPPAARPVRWEPPPDEHVELDVMRLERELDRRWRRVSYTGIVVDREEPWVASEVEEAPGSDEPTGSAPAPLAGDDERSAGLSGVPVLLDALPANVRVGTLVHSVLEATDFAAPDVEAELLQAIEERRLRRGVEVGDPGLLAAGLRAALETPLGPLVGGMRLRDLQPDDRMNELTFELPLAGGDQPTGDVSLAAMAELVRAALPADDPLAGYADRLAELSASRSLRGYMTGSIDLVARVRHQGERPRVAVVDYKTHRLARSDERLTAWHHRPAVLAAQMMRGHYALQALLYSVALHRYLRWRMHGYDPEQDLAGVLFLFLRGMIGADTPVVGDAPCGVLAWRPPARLVTDLSDLLEGRAS